MSEWQDIKTAPRDGTPFLAYRPSGKKHRVISAWYCNETPDRWGGSLLQCMDHTGKAIWASHWMPLPDPPETKAREVG